MSNVKLSDFRLSLIKSKGIQHRNYAKPVWYKGQYVLPNKLLEVMTQ